MHARSSAPSTIRLASGTTLIGVAVLAAVALGAVVRQPSPRPAPVPSVAAAGGAARPESLPLRESPTGVDDGVLPAGTTAYDDGYPGVANLDPGLLRALRAAAADAGRDGVALTINSGWRSREYQDRLLHEAVAEYGSVEAAARWVATPDTSPHVAGEAVDVGSAAATWLATHGAAYGLCPVYRNEPWHYELRAGAVDDGCPHMYADPTHDPRLRR